MNRFDPGDRTYHLSDERLRSFRALPPEAKLRWLEEMAMFLHLARQSRACAQAESENAERKR